MADWTPEGIQRRAAGHHDLRMDGITDLVLRARSAAVLDVGCNRGMVGYEFACNGARLVHGCDIDPDSIYVARSIFADKRDVTSRFEVVDLTEGSSSLKTFGTGYYDIVLLLAVVHKLSRVMELDELERLMRYFVSITKGAGFLAWRGTQRDKRGNENELALIDSLPGLVRVQYSTISDLGPAAIWKKEK